MEYSAEGKPRMRSYGMVKGDADNPQFWWLLSNEMLAKRIGWWACIPGSWIWTRWLTMPVALLQDMICAPFRPNQQEEQ